MTTITPKKNDETARPSELLEADLPESGSEINDEDLQQLAAGLKANIENDVTTFASDGTRIAEGVGEGMTPQPAETAEIEKELAILDSEVKALAAQSLAEIDAAMAGEKAEPANEDDIREKRTPAESLALIEQELGIGLDIDGLASILKDYKLDDQTIRQINTRLVEYLLEGEKEKARAGRSEEEIEQMISQMEAALDIEIRGPDRAQFLLSITNISQKIQEYAENKQAEQEDEEDGVIDDTDDDTVKPKTPVVEDVVGEKTAPQQAPTVERPITPEDNASRFEEESYAKPSREMVKAARALGKFGSKDRAMRLLLAADRKNNQENAGSPAAEHENVTVSFLIAKEMILFNEPNEAARILGEAERHIGSDITLNSRLLYLGYLYIDMKQRPNAEAVLAKLSDQGESGVAKAKLENAIKINASPEGYIRDLEKLA